LIIEGLVGERAKKWSGETRTTNTGEPRKTEGEGTVGSFHRAHLKEEKLFERVDTSWREKSMRSG